MQWKWHKTSECHYGYLVSYYTFCNAHLVAKLMLDCDIMLDLCEDCSVPFSAVALGLANMTSSIMRSAPFLADPVDRAEDLGAPNRMPTGRGRLAT